MSEVEEEPASEGAVSGAEETLPNTDADKISVSTQYAVAEMVSLTKTSAGKTVLTQENKYNEDGQRISRAENGRTRNYYYDNGTVAYTKDGDSVSTANVLSTEGAVVGSFRGKDWYGYLKDAQGSTSSIVKEDGSLAAAYDYTDFGETEEITGGGFENEICYTGAVYDAQSGLYYLNARYYDPENGRFISQDSYRGEMEDPGQWHLYAYCANNPVNYVDPSGHIVTPFLERDGKTKKVLIFLRYTGKSKAKGISFHMLKLWNGNWITTEIYKKIGPKKGHYYRWKRFEATKSGYAYFGYTMKIPKKKKRVHVSTQGLHVDYVGKSWVSQTEISGSWKISGS